MYRNRPEAPPPSHAGPNYAIRTSARTTAIRSWLATSLRRTPSLSDRARSDTLSVSQFPVGRPRSRRKQDPWPVAASALLVASCEARGFVDPPVVVTVGPNTRFSSAACTSHRVRPDGSPAPLSRAWPRSAETRVSPKPRLGACRLAASGRADAEVTDGLRSLPVPRSSDRLAATRRRPQHCCLWTKAATRSAPPT